jgi:tungstate transport system permease protein
MGHLLEDLAEAVRMLFRMDREVFEAIRVTLSVSIVSTILASIVGIPLGFLIALKEFPGKRLVIVFLQTLFALPTVLVGLMVMTFLSRRGPLGSYGMLFTPTAIIIGQFILACPIIASLSLSATKGLDPRISRTALTLGGSRLQAAFVMLREARFSYYAAVLAGFGRVFAEVGVSMMLGGNFPGKTRTITTTIALESSKGEFALGIALGMVLLFVAFSVNLVLQFLQGRKPA